MANNDKTVLENHAHQDNKSLFGFTFLHFMNDMHSTSLPTILPMLVQSIGISLSQAGLLSAVFGLTNICAQPVFGYFADRQRRPWFAVWGPMLSITGACLLPLAPNYAAAIIFVGCMSVGTALFHPQGSGRSGSSAGGKNLAFCLSLFAACGSFGSALGPIYVVFMTSLLTKTFFPVMIIPAFSICLFVWKYVVTEQKNENITKDKARLADFFGNIKVLFGKVGDVVAITSIRDATFQGIKIFLPMLIITRGGTIQAGGISLFALTLAGTIAGIIGGRLADEIGDTKILMYSITAAPIFLFAGIYTTGIFSLFMLMAGFAFLQCSTPVTTAIAQKKCPESRSTVSSLALGVSWGAANLFTTPIGFAADAIGLQATLNIVAFMPWVVTAWHIGKKYLKK